MRRAAALLLLAAPLGAQCLDSLQADVTDTSLKLTGETDTVGSATKFRLQYGPTSSLGYIDTQGTAADATEASRWFNIATLEPGAKVYLSPEVSDTSGSYVTDYTDCQTELCPSGAGAQPDSDIVCEDIGAGVLMPTVTAATDAGDIDAPTLPTHTRTLAQIRTSPTIDGSTFNVDASCDDMQEQINAAAAASTSLNHEVVLPAGTFCRPELENSTAGVNLGRYDIPAKNGTGVVTIRCGWDSDHAVPSGVQYTPGLRNSQSCGFELNHTTVDSNGPFWSSGAYFYLVCTTEVCTKGWRFEGLVFTTGDWRDQSLRQIAVDSVDTGTGDLTLASSATKILATALETTMSLPGITNSSANADTYARGDASPTISGTSFNPSVAAGWTGTYAGGGFVSMPIAFDVESCTAEADPTCTLAAAHGMSDYAAKSITTLTSGVLTLASGHGITANADVVVEGNDTCDGTHGVTAVTSTTLTLDEACSGSGGTVRRLHTGWFFEMVGSGASTIEGVRNIDFPSGTTVKVYDIDLSGLAISDGGLAPQTAPTMRRWFNSTARFTGSTLGLSNWTCDRCLFIHEEPFRAASIMGMSGDGDIAGDFAVVDSWIDGGGHWLPASPHTDLVDQAQLFPPFSSILVLFSGNSARDFTIANTTARWGGMFWFSDAAGHFGAQDLSLLGNIHMWNDERRGNSATAPPHRTYSGRHSLEFKAAKRVLIDGYATIGLPPLAVSTGASIYFSYWPSSLTWQGRAMEDLTLRNIWLKGVNAGIGLWFHSEGSQRGLVDWDLLRRVSVSNWLVDAVPWPGLRTPAIGQSLETAGPWSTGGGALHIVGPVEDVTFDKFTIRRAQASGWGPTIVLGGNRSNGVQFTKGILSYAGTSSEDGIWTYDSHTNALTPPFTANGEAGFREWATWMGNQDDRSFFGSVSEDVVVVPCLDDNDSNTPDFSTANNAYSAAVSAWSCSTCTGFDVEVVGADSQSCATREALVMDSDLDASGGYAGRGVDTTALYAAFGMDITVAISSMTSSGATIGYTIPASTPACTVDHGTSATFASYTRATDGGSGASRSVSASGYSAGQTIYYRVLCQGLQQAWGSFLL